MGPGCFHPRNPAGGSGNSVLLARFNGAGMFPSQKSPQREPITPQSLKVQWGRDVSIPEILYDSGIKAADIRLQWGRDVSIPEITGGNGRHSTTHASMGPGCFHPRNTL